MAAGVMTLMTIAVVAAWTEMFESRRQAFVRRREGVELR